MTITPGMTLTKTYIVKEEHTAFHIGSGTVKVLGTPIMIAYMEITAMELLQQVLDEAHTTVGTVVNIRHLAPSPLGAEIKATARVTEVDGAKVTLQVDAWYGDTLIGTGSHGRYVINIEAFQQLLAGG